MGCDGCRRLREPWTQCRPCAPRSEPPRCGNNGWHRRGGARDFVHDGVSLPTGPGWHQHSHITQSPFTLTGPRLHRGKTEASADSPFATGGETPARLSYLLVYINPRGVLQRAVSGSRYTLSDPQVSQSICWDHSFWAAQGLSIMHSAHALDLVFGRLVLGHQSCPSQSTKSRPPPKPCKLDLVPLASPLLSPCLLTH